MDYLTRLGLMAYSIPHPGPAKHKPEPKPERVTEMARIEVYLRSVYPATVRPGEVAEAIGAKQGTVRSVLTRLWQAGKVASVEPGRWAWRG